MAFLRIFFVLLILGVSAHLRHDGPQQQLNADPSTVSLPFESGFGRARAIFTSLLDQIPLLDRLFVPPIPFVSRLLEPMALRPRGWNEAQKVEQQESRLKREDSRQRKVLQKTESDFWTVVLRLFAIPVHMLILGILAYLYLMFRNVPKGKYNEERHKDMDGDWSHHCLSFWQEPLTACCGCCCFAIRWAETISMVRGLLSFWVAFFLMLVLQILRLHSDEIEKKEFSFATVLALLAWLGVILAGTFYRQQIRKQFKMDNTYFDLLKDFLMHCCCACCAVVQEARHVEEALAREHPATALVGRTRSIRRKDCWTQRIFTADGPEYVEYEIQHMSS